MGKITPQSVPMTEHLSPSGKYMLQITSIPTRPGCWDVTRGVVSKAGGGELQRRDGTGQSPVPEQRHERSEIAIVDRNYSAFPYLFIDGHPDGHDYLVCGQDYQGQTLVQLDTGERREAMSPGADQGHGYCWTEYRFDPASKILVAGGCIWAGPHEFRFYDFSDPMAGWPHLELTGSGVQWEAHDQEIWWEGRDGQLWPEIAAGQDGVTIRCFIPERDDEDEDEDKPQRVAAITTLRREAGKLVFVGEEITESERERRRRWAEGNARYKKWLEDFRASDPLYLMYEVGVERLQKVLPPDLEVEGHESHGVTPPGWGKGTDYEGSERRWCRRLVQPRRDEDGVLHLEKGPVVDLEWAVETGPIKVMLRAGGRSETQFFEHSTEGMAMAIGLCERVARKAEDERGADS
jgi:hypothetical protein